MKVLITHACRLMTIAAVIYASPLAMAGSSKVDPCTGKRTNDAFLNSSYIPIRTAEEFNEKIMSNTVSRNDSESGQAFDTLINKNFILCNDIDFSGKKVATANVYFDLSVFDGGGHRIKFDANSIDAPAYGLFGIIDNFSMVRRLALDGIRVADTMYIGALAGKISHSTIRNIQIENAHLTTKADFRRSLDGIVGGLAGACFDSELTNIRILNSVVGQEARANYGPVALVVAGGLCGQSHFNTVKRLTVRGLKSFSAKDLSSSSSLYALKKNKDAVGGVFGIDSFSRILMSSVNDSDLIAACNIGGMVGLLDFEQGETIANSHVTKANLTLANAACDPDFVLPGPAGLAAVQGAAGLIGNTLPLTRGIVLQSNKLAKVYIAAKITAPVSSSSLQSCVFNGLSSRRLPATDTRPEAKTVVKDVVYDSDLCQLPVAATDHKGMNASSLLRSATTLQMQDAGLYESIYQGFRFTPITVQDSFGFSRTINNVWTFGNGARYPVLRHEEAFLTNLESAASNPPTPPSPSIPLTPPTPPALPVMETGGTTSLSDMPVWVGGDTSSVGDSIEDAILAEIGLFQE